MDITAYLVDWDKLDTEWKVNAAEPRWGSIADSGEPWVRCPETQVESSASYNSEVGDLFWGVADNLEPEERKALGDFLSAFALNVREDDEDEEFETPLEIDREKRLYVASALSPSTVERYIALHSALPLDRIVEVANSELENGISELESGEEFGKFINSWAQLLQEARQSASGVLVVVG